MRAQSVYGAVFLLMHLQRLKAEPGAHVGTFAQLRPRQGYIGFEGVRECPHGSDELLNECIKLILEENRVHVSEGLPQIGLQPLDPLRVPEFPVPAGDGLRLNYTWKNIEVRGFSNYSSAEVKVNSTRKTIDFRFAYPRLQINADYVRGGRLLLHTLVGSGKVQLDLFNFQANGTYYLTLLRASEPDGPPTVGIVAVSIETGVESIQSHVPTLTAKGVAGQLLNQYLTTNAKWLYEEFVRPQLQQEFANYLIEHSTIPRYLPATYFLSD